MTEIQKSLKSVVEAIPNPINGLPDPVFEFILRVTPVINVDLLIQLESRGTLLTWREDSFGVGWHIPGGIIRFFETLTARIAAVAKLELRATVEADSFPCDINQFFSPRGHFISLLYRCKRISEFTDPAMLYVSGRPCRGAIGWFKSMPEEMYRGHEVYEKWLNT